MRVELTEHPELSHVTFASFSPSSVFTALSAAMSDCQTPRGGRDRDRERVVNKDEGLQINERQRRPHGRLWSQRLMKRQMFGPLAEAPCSPRTRAASSELLPDDISDPLARPSPLCATRGEIRGGTAAVLFFPASGFVEVSCDGSLEGDINKFCGPAGHYHPIMPGHK